MKYAHTYILFICLLIGVVPVLAQDDSDEQANADGFTEKELQEEEQYMKFKNFFMEAQREKSIENFGRAQEHLNECEKIYPNNMAMLFEKAKNHYELKQFAEAHLYCDKALTLQPDSFWVKELKKKVYLKENNYPAALALQKELYSADASQAENLLNLYMILKDYENGKKLLQEVERKIIFVENLSMFEAFFNKTKVPIQNTETNTIVSQPTSADTFSSFKTTLEQLSLTDNYQQLIEKSMQALGKFPTEPLTYYYNGWANNRLKNHQKAIQTLENGLDFVFDNNTLLLKFYNELVTAYSALNNVAKANYYKQLVQKLQKQ